MKNVSQSVLRSAALAVILIAILIVAVGVSTRPALAVAPSAPNSDYAVPGWMKDAVIYQIFPERFRNGNTANDPAGTVAWSSVPSPSNFFGGDLQGVIDEINAGYFNDLGVNTLYFNPIFIASSNHKYNTGDYYNIDTHFGNNALFDTLMAAANAHGLKVILDGVFNHAGDDSKYVDAYNQWSDVGACESASSVYRSWFTTGSQGTCPDGWKWNGWAGYSSIPEFAEVTPVKQFFYQGGSPQSPGGVGVTQYWLNKGIAGWRFDVAFDITHAWWQDFRPYVKNTWPQAVLIGEVWPCGGGSTDSPAYLQGTELDSVMNYCFKDAALNFANGGSPSGFNNYLTNLRAAMPPSPFNALMNMLDSHDTVRVLNALGGSTQRVKLVSLLQMTMPGAPSVYYGTEVSVPGNNDPDDRRTYPWADKGGSPDTNMYAHYKKVIGLRNTNSALRGGTFDALLVDDNTHLYGYMRTDASEKVLVILNSGGSTNTATVNVSAFLANGSVVMDLLNGNATYTVTNGSVSVPVTSLWGVILRNCATCPTPTLVPTPSPIPQTPYGGTAWAIPGTIQAENYDNGGEGSAYHDLETANQGGQYRTADGVDIEASSDTGGGFDVGWTRTGEWDEYTVNVATAGNYTLTERVASGQATGSFSVSFGGVNKTGTVTVANTGGFQTWVTLTQTVSLSAGQQIMRIDWLGNDTNINSLTFTGGSGATSTPTFTQAPPTATRTPTSGASNTPVAPTATPAGGNKVVNPGFETGNTSGWTMTSGNFGVDSADVHSGSFKLYFWNSGGFSQKAEQTITGLTNGNHTVTAWVKQNSGTPTLARMELSNYGGSIVYVNAPHGTTYVQISATVNVTNGQINIAFYEAGTAVNLQIDDVVMQ